MRRIISITLILESAEVQPLIVALYSNERRDTADENIA